MELKALQEKQDELIDVPLLFNKDGEPSDGFKVLGANSEQYQEAVRQMNMLAYKKTSRRGGGIDASTETGAIELAAAVDKRVDFIAKACIVEIYGFTENGNPMLLNEKTLDALFQVRPTWRNKVIAAIEQERVFT